MTRAIAGVFVVLCFVCGCSKKELVPEGWKLFDARYFLIQAPEDWRLQVGLGEDTCDGALFREDGEVALGFVFARGPLGEVFTFETIIEGVREETDDFEVLPKRIDGHEAHILIVPEGEGHQVGLFFFDLPQKGTFIIATKFSATEEAKKLYLKIFDTIQFIPPG